MVWKIEIDKDAQHEMRKLDKQVAKRITSKLKEISLLDDPRSMGKALVGNLAGLWRYRVGDYRIICAIEDGKLLVLVVDIGHRKNIYN